MIWLSLAFLFSTLYGTTQSWRYKGRWLAPLKGLSMGLLAVAAERAGAPTTTVLAILFCGLADTGIPLGRNWSSTRFLTVAQALYIPGYALHMTSLSTLGLAIGPATLVAASATLTVFAICHMTVGTLRPDLRPAWMGYGVTLIALVTAAFMIPQGGLQAQAGSLLALSGVTLYGVEMVLVRDGSLLQNLTSPVIWTTYFLGHVLLSAQMWQL
ncbi:hypothetical protein [Roseobacter sp. HKCCA0434]|uniref:hypothetical protein n=1 Tax=Roseobacter sp. HKCCA0434 TaxID=3079297 RepID=UPI002905EC06|nr:hypothetical protein [Roseobacter sp. HKCCA0434]